MATMDHLTYQKPNNSQYYPIDDHLSRGGKLWLIGILDEYKFPLIVAILFTSYIYRSYKIWSSLKHIPTVGAPEGFMGYWAGSWNYVTRSQEIMAEGYEKYAPSGQPFKISTFRRYLICVTDPQHTEELRKARDDMLNFNTSIEERMHFKWTMDRSVIDEPYHLHIVRKELTQRLTHILPDLMEEIKLAFAECADIGDEWVKVDVFSLLVDVIARASNRMFVGVSLCRNKDYLNACLNNAISISGIAMALDFLPGPLRPVVAWATLGRLGYIKTVVKHIRPILEERRRKMATGEKWDRPNDALQWLLEQAPPGRLSTDEQLAIRLLILNFAAIHTSSLSLLHIIYDLAAAPSYIPPLLSEVDGLFANIPDSQITKQNLTLLRKLDSVLRESQRLNGLGMMTLTRKCLTDYTFSSGAKSVHMPKGATVSAATAAIHKDTTLYSNPYEFDGFRFSREADAAAAASTVGTNDPDSDQKEKFLNHKMFVTTSPEYLPFGHGKHACPGRFFASNELKLIMMHILRNYEFRLAPECGGKRPANQGIFGIIRPAMGKLVEFRRRK